MSGIERKKHFDGFESISISYDVSQDGSPAAGMHLTDGEPVSDNGIEAVRFSQKIKGRTLYLVYDKRPDLAALVAEYKNLEAEKKAAVKAKWAAEEAADRELLNQMQHDADALRATIPAGHVEVTVTKSGDLDGWPILEYHVGDTELNWEQVELIGSAAAVRPGASGAFAEVWIASIDAGKLAEIRTAQQEQKAAQAIAADERKRDLITREIPGDALELYHQYHGDPDRAYEDEGAGAAAAVYLQEWVPYIEAQHGMDRLKLRSLAEAATREQSYGIDD